MNNGVIRKMTHLAVQFDGVLEVTDPAKFLETVRQGIGSAKGFGFGLLSLARVS
jgi:CRISPR system Cascade subunit CasE